MSEQTTEFDDIRSRVMDEVPDECWVTRSTDPEWRCTRLIGGVIGIGPGVWTRDMCCLPCRIRDVVSPPGQTGGAR